MSRPLNIALVCGPDCELETQAMRSVLEYFGARIMTYWIGRANDFISILSGDDLPASIDFLILNFHGDEGKLIMPELGDDVYEEDEPRGDFGKEEIIRYGKFNGITVIGNGCTLGHSALADAFLQSGCPIYIGPDDYPLGNAALMFMLRFFYEIIEHERDIKEAYRLAIAADEHLKMYKLYEKKHSFT